MKKVAIIGVSGLVGQTVLEVLEEECLTEDLEIHMFGSEKSKGLFVSFRGLNYPIKELNESVVKDRFDYVLLLTDEKVSLYWAEKFIDNGVRVIDNSSAFRLEKNVPLIVPEINQNIVKNNDRIIANPNCSTIQLVVVLDKLLQISKINKVIVSSYQSVSGAGKDALLDLNNQTNKIFQAGIVDNVIAHIGKIGDDGYCSEENKIIKETKKILNQDFDIFATTVRVPISFCHAESVYVEFEDEYDLSRVRSALECEYISVSDDIFYPKECKGSNITYVCRIRKAGNKGLLLFIIADNLRRGAAYNAVKILKNLLKIKD